MNEWVGKFSHSCAIALIICGCFIGIFAALSWTAVITKNATIDEPTQFMSGISELRWGDYRLEIVSPPLWQCWAALGATNKPIKASLDGPNLEKSIVAPVEEIQWSNRTLFSTRENDGNLLINRGRAMMLVIGVCVAIVVGGWSFNLAGPISAIVAVGCFCLDPNFIAQAPLIKGDVAFALAMLSMAWAFKHLVNAETSGDFCWSQCFAESV